MRSEPDPNAAARPLVVALVVTDAEQPSNGELRLLDHLTMDSRYVVGGLWHEKAPAAEKRSWLSRLEDRLVPLPDPYTPKAWQPRRANPMPTAPVNCDVLIDFSSDPAVELLGASARYGVWRLDAYGPDAGFAEAMTGTPATAVRLERHGPDGWSPMDGVVYDTKFLARRNNEYIREKSVQLIVRALARLHSDGEVAEAPTRQDPCAPVSTVGYVRNVLGEIAGRANERISARMGRPKRGFNLRIGFGDVGDFDPAAGIDVPMPHGHFWADPFLIEHKGQVYCLFEDFDYATGLGHIGAGVLTDTGMEDLGPVFTAPHHLSFPFLFRHAGNIFMMPESHQAGRLEIWRATDFPHNWELHSTAFEGTRVADTVLLKHRGAWWLFTGYCTDSFGDFCGELHLFQTSGPNLKWLEPHPLNPVVIGAGTARGGGRIHTHNGRLLRIAQDNSGGIYGWGLNVMEIERLTADDYFEQRIRHIPPDFAPGLIGGHHFDAAGGRWVMDVRRP